MRRRFCVRLGIAAIGIVVMRLSIATVARAQTPDEATPPVAPIRVELGFATGVTIVVPELAGLASVPLGPGSAIEVVVARMPAYWDAPAHSLAQVQFRMPFRPDLRSRKSLLLGVTRIHALDSDEDFLGIDSSTFVRPHAGVSLQWPVAPTLDFRFDAQGILVLAKELPILPRGMAALVWHPRQAKTSAQASVSSRRTRSEAPR